MYLLHVFYCCGIFCQCSMAVESFGCVLWVQVLFHYFIQYSVWSLIVWSINMILEELIQKLESLVVIDESKNQKLIKFIENSKNNLPFGVFKETYSNGTLSDWKMMDVEKRNKFVKVSRLRIMIFDKNHKNLELEIEGNNYLFFLYCCGRQRGTNKHHDKQG